MGFWLLKIGAAFLLTYLGVKALNNLFPSVRPFIVDGIAPLTPHGNDPSFPSSHAADGAVMAYFIWSLRKDWGIAAFGLVGLIGAGRVAAHLHYPIDIVGGVILGVLASYLVLKFWPRKLT